VVGGIKPRSFKNDLGGCDDLFQRLFAALGAGLQWVIREGLLFFELNSTILTAVGIDGHSISPCFLLSFFIEYDCGIIALLIGCDKPSEAACYNFLTKSET
jgi:hypothetical protein